MRYADMDVETRKALNQLAREQTKMRLLADISLDIEVCKIEGWDYREYIGELVKLVSSLGKS